MATCKKIKRLSERVCAGSLNKKISVLDREIEVPVGDSVDFDENFILIKDTWAMVQTVAGKVFFDNSNIDKSITHEWYIRYIAGIEITAEHWVLYNTNFFKIINVENLDEANRFLLLRTTERGESTKKVNFA
jgi:head-tail adaptor